MMPGLSDCVAWAGDRCWRPSRRQVLLSGLLALGAGWSSGCSQFDVNSQGPEEEIDELETNVKLVSHFGTPFGFYPVKVEGLALVTQLRGTGGDPPPSMLRTALINEMRVRGVDKSSQLLASNNTAMVLAVGYLRPGIRKGDHFDVTVQVPPNDPTTSLHGGYLMETRMTELQARDEQLFEGHLLGVAQGPILVDPLADGKKDKKALLTGKVLGGAMATKDRDLGIALRADYRSPRTSDQVAKAISTRFHIYQAGSQLGVASAKTDEFIELKIPPRYRDNLARYAAVVRAIPVRETGTERIARLKLLERQLLDPITALKAAIALEAIGNDAIDTLKRGLASSDPEVRFYAAEALAYLDVKEAAGPLTEAATDETAFRVYALAGLGAMRDIAAYEALLKLLHVPSAETRYGAFRALWNSYPDDPKFRGEGLKKQFSYHVINSQAPPLVHVTSNFRPEIVLFGADHRLAPCMLEVGQNLLVSVRSEQEAVVSRVALNEPTERRTVAGDLDAIIRAAVEVGASYGDIVQMLHQAKEKKVLTSRLEVDALPEVGRSYRRKSRRPGEAENEELKVSSPAPDLFETDNGKSKRARQSDDPTAVEPAKVEPAKVEPTAAAN